jgi:ABC-type multidrug transport system fused ATPase/permease subunit
VRFLFSIMCSFTFVSLLVRWALVDTSASAAAGCIYRDTQACNAIQWDTTQDSHVSLVQVTALMQPGAKKRRANHKKNIAVLKGRTEQERHKPRKQSAEPMQKHSQRRSLRVVDADVVLARNVMNTSVASVVKGSDLLARSGADHSISANLESSMQTALDSDLSADICGGRLLMPQLQFQLEVYRHLGLLHSQYSKCRVLGRQSLLSLTPNVQKESLPWEVAPEKQLHSLRQAKKSRFLNDMQNKRARLLAVFWVVAVAYTIGSFMISAYATGHKRAHQLAKAPGQQGVQGGCTLSWIDPVFVLFGTKAPAEVGTQEINGVGPDFHTDPPRAFRAAWHEEVANEGLVGANLSSVLRRFIGIKTLMKIISIVGVTMVLELVGLTVVLDVLLNYLRWASDSHSLVPSISLDTLGPSLMVIGLSFVFPLVARYFGIIASMADGYHGSRIVAGLLAAIYEKSQRLPLSESTDVGGAPMRCDVNQLVSDVSRVWTMALKNYAQLLVSPFCMLMFVGILVYRIGTAAIVGALACSWICVLYVPARIVVRRQHMRWLRLTDERAKLVKTLISNICGVKALATEMPLTDDIYALREKELQTRLEFSMATFMMSLPVTLFPFGFVCSTLFFRIAYFGSPDQPITVKDLFACMQVVAGLIVCCSTFSTALQRTITIPNSVKRVERFLKEPELQKKADQELRRHPNAPLAQVSGSFAFGPNQPAALRDVGVSVQKGELVAVIGKTASGKSALLGALLGELQAVDSEARIDSPECIAYCAQTPWLVDGELHENIVLGEPLERGRYEGALAAASLTTCALSDLAEDVSKKEPVPLDARSGPFPYFSVWNMLVAIALALCILNIDWGRTPILFGVVIVLVQGMLHWSVMEIPLQTIASLFVTPAKCQRADASHLTVCLNYNLLAVHTADVDESLANMYSAFMGNVSNNVSAVLVSATNDPSLRDYELQLRDQYRDRIYEELVREGLVWAGFERGDVDPGRLQRVWSGFKNIDRNEFAQVHLQPICKRFTNEFMVLHRVSRVLRKCGQYQDLMLLSQGHERSFTYCDESLYGEAARPYGEPLFFHSEDTTNVKDRHFDYTLVLDADTRVVPGSVFELLEIGAGNPERAIVQPAIHMDCNPGDPFFMHIEGLRQQINAPLHNVLATVLGECGFFGKGLIKNSEYIKQIVGTPEALIEAVPIDVLSHDTFEAVMVQPLYVGEVQLLEAPAKNYVTWDIRERRWNRGELLLSMYFFPHLVGVPMRWAQSVLQGREFQKTRVRTLKEFGPVSSYLAHSALRQILLKPLLVFYIVLMDFVEMHYEWTPFLVVMFLIIVFPKFATCNRSNIKAVLLETTASILQFTPECVVGTIRVLRALRAHLSGNARWVPQRAVEEDFERSNPILFSLMYLWYYPCFAVLVGLLVTNLMPEASYVMWMLGTLLTLPLYAGVTALKTPRAIHVQRQFPYFGLWNIFALMAIALGTMNVNWEMTSPGLGLVVVAVQGMLHWSVMELPLQTLATLFHGSKPKSKRADHSHLTLCMSYNLLATSKRDIDDCMENMYNAYMGNISENVSAVLVSATNDPALKDYEVEVRNLCRDRIYKELVHEGLIWAGFEHGKVDAGRYERLWSKFSHIDPQTFAQVHLNVCCKRFAREFMVVHRVSRVLRKCGQYQDLMLLSAGENRAFTYCDERLYQEQARDAGEALFQASEDVDNICRRGFEYTLVLDADTGVDPNTVFDMLAIGAAHPERAIIQPAIHVDCKPGDSIFGHVEAIRQILNEPLTNTAFGILDECGFYGKGLVKNSVYIEKCLGSPEAPLEVVPIDVLSHDTFEAAVVRPLYAGDVYLREAPCGNYVTWDIREMRWNRGELLLAMYFFPKCVGRPMRWLQSRLQGKHFQEPRLRTKANFNKVSEYIAHAALRQILLKPCLVVYIALMDFVELRYPWTPFLLSMFLIVVFPKFASGNFTNLKAVFLETTASVLQFTPECVVGTIRILRSLRAHLTGKTRWVPQQAVEDEFEKSNPFLFSLSYLWYYPCFALLAGFLVSVLIPDGAFIMWMLGTLFTLPLYAGFTGLRTPARRAGLPWEANNEDWGLGLYKVPFSEHWLVEAGSAAADSWLNRVAIGSRGAFLSASERAQVSFARAAYHTKADLVLLDDPFAAMDQVTGERLLNEIIVGSLFKNRARVVALPPSVSKEQLQRFNRIVVLEEGRVAAQGSPDEVMATHCFHTLCDGQPNVSLRHGDAQHLPALPRLIADKAQPAEGEGQCHWRTLLEAGLAGGPSRLVFAAAALLVVRVAVSCQVLILGVWADRKQTHDAVSDRKFVRTMAALIVSAGILQAAQNYLILSFGNAASSTLFRRVFSSILRSSFGGFWGLQPAGRIFNRLSGDVLTLDLAPSGILVMSSFAGSLGLQQIYCLLIMPRWLAIPMYVTMAFLAHFCLRASTPLQNASLMALSKCHEAQALAMASPESVRAYCQEDRQIARYCAHAGAAVKPQYFGVACAKQWLIFRISICLCFQCTACMLCGVLRHGAVNIGTLAMVALLTFSLIQDLEGFVDALINGIGVTLSLERLTESICNDERIIESKEEEEQQQLQPRESEVVAQGLALEASGGVALQIQDLYAGYLARAGDIIVGVSCELAPGAWLGVVGAVGSGKTALLLAISQLIAPRAGRVLLGGKDISNRREVSSQLLRRLVRFVPHEPSIFEGSVRFNVDPDGEHSDEQVWQALRCARCSAKVENLGGLDYRLSMKGGGLSFGERQLICLARALCSAPALLLLDGSLCAVDLEIQVTIRRAVATQWPQMAVIVATQPNENALDFDRLLVLESGVVVDSF